MKKIFIFILLILCVGCNLSSNKPILKTHENTISIIVATDIHYLSKELTDHNDRFIRMLENGDGKLTIYIDEIIDAFIEEVIEFHPDYLILSGDLTFNGEKISHEQLSQKLIKVQENNIQVLVLPGNHDIYNLNAHSFKDERVYAVDTVMPEEFQSIYQEYGFNQAISKDEASLSYVIEANENLWILMIDGNTPEMPGILREQTRIWIQEKIAEANKNKVQLLPVMHQNLFMHNELFPFGYQMFYAEEVLELFSNANIIASLSGHMHFQNILEKEDITEIVTSSLSVFPNQYGIILYNKGNLEYKTKDLNMEKWATQQNILDENLMNFEEYTLSYFSNKSKERLVNSLSTLDILEEDKEAMVEFYLNLNANYFAGKETDLTRYEEVIQLWRDHPQPFYSQYLEIMIQESNQNKTEIKLYKK